MNFKKLFLAISIVAARVPWSGDFDPTFMSTAPEKLRVLYGEMSIHRQQEFWERRVSFEKVKDPPPGSPSFFDHRNSMALCPII